MIVVRAPLRVSFLGGGTDLPDFYRKHTGKVISTTIDKYVYVAINRTPLINKISARYAMSETVDHPRLLEHTRIKKALMDLRIYKGIEIASFASLPSKTGLGSSSSFSVALLQGLHAYLGKKLTKEEIAQKACRLEIELVGEPIGKQDQYAASFGGFNIYTFNPDDTVTVKPLLLDYKKRLKLENHLMVFFTGKTRSAADVLIEQKGNINSNFKILKEMADSVDEFAKRLSTEDFHGAGKMIHQGWLRKKSLSTKISSSIIDQMYDVGMDAGAWGGKILGAGGGGCMMFMVPNEKKRAVRKKISLFSQKNHLEDFVEIPMRFVQSGAEVLFNADQALK